MKLIATELLLIAAMLTAIAWAADAPGLVTVRGIHLSCDACVTNSEASSKDISEVTDAKADLNGRSLTFKAKDEDLLHGTFVISRDGQVLWAETGLSPFTDNKTLLFLIAKEQSTLSQSTQQTAAGASSPRGEAL